MSKQIAVIPLADIVRAGMVEAKGRSMAQVQADEGCDYILPHSTVRLGKSRKGV